MRKRMGALCIAVLAVFVMIVGTKAYASCLSVRDYGCHMYKEWYYMGAPYAYGYEPVSVAGELGIRVYWAQDNYGVCVCGKNEVVQERARAWTEWHPIVSEN